MGKFIKRTLLFGLLVFSLLFISEILVPHHWVTFRSWEAFKNKSPIFVGHFFPNQHVIRSSYGDGAYHTEHAIEKENIEWYTDELGFRNKEFIKKPDILFIGASNINGSSVTQDSIISSRVADLTGYSTYNIAPGRFNRYLQLVNAGIIDEPKMMVYGCIERMIPGMRAKPKRLPPIYNEKPIGKFVRENTPDVLKVTYLRLQKRNTKNFLKARIAGEKGYSFRSKIDKRMTFPYSKKARIKLDEKKLRKNVNAIKSYDNYKKVTVINTLKLYNEEKNNRLLYHYDDSHWNENGIDVVANEVARLAKEHIGK